MLWVMFCQPVKERKEGRTGWRKERRKEKFILCIWKAEWQRRREWDLVSLPQMALQPGAEATSREFHPGYPCAWQGPTHLACHLLLLQAHVQGAGWEVKLLRLTSAVIWGVIIWSTVTKWQSFVESWREGPAWNDAPKVQWNLIF